MTNDEPTPGRTASSATAGEAGLAVSDRRRTAVELSTKRFGELLRRPEAPATTADDDLPAAADVKEGWLRLKVAAHRALESEREFVARQQSQPFASAVADQTWLSANQIVREAEQAMKSLEVGVDEIVDVLDQVPERLEGGRDAALARSARITELAQEAEVLLGAEVWEGEAAESYRSTVRVQVAALNEFAGVESSTAWGLDKAALLVRATFLEVSQTLSLAARRVNAQPSRGVGQLGSGARFVRAVADQVGKDIAGAMDDLRGGVVVLELANDLSRLIETPNVLTDADWPTGDFDAVAADTASVITDPDA